jgi:hypothetical protein
MNTYEKNGWDDRNDYLRGQAENYGIDFATVQFLADTLGESEDFDGLISSLEDIEFENDFKESPIADEFIKQLFG